MNATPTPPTPAEALGNHWRSHVVAASAVVGGRPVVLLLLLLLLMRVYKSDDAKFVAYALPPIKSQPNPKAITNPKPQTPNPKPQT